MPTAICSKKKGLQIKLSVIIPSHCRPQSLLNCLFSCLQQEFVETDLEIIVVVQSPEDFDSPELKQVFVNHSHCRLEYVNGPGANRARNLGVEKAKGDIIYFIDDDCVLPDRKFFLRLLAEFERQHIIDALGGPYLSLTSKGPQNLYNLVTRIWLGRHNINQNIRALLGGNSAYRQRVFADGNRFNQDIEYGGTETEFNRRLVTSGKQLGYCDRLAVFHNGTESWREIWLKAWRQGRGKAKYGGANMADRGNLLVPPLKTWPYFAVMQVAFIIYRIEAWAR